MKCSCVLGQLALIFLHLFRIVRQFSFVTYIDIFSRIFRMCSLSYSSSVLLGIFLGTLSWFSLVLSRSFSRFSFVFFVGSLSWFSLVPSRSFPRFSFVFSLSVFFRSFVSSLAYFCPFSLVFFVGSLALTFFHNVVHALLCLWVAFSQFSWIFSL